MNIGMESCGPNPRTYSKAEYDALHADAEALRAENGRLTNSLSAMSSLWPDSMRNDEQPGRIGFAARTIEIVEAARAILTATTAPEVQAEQGERQEAIGWVGQSHIVEGRFPIWNTEDGSVPAAGTMLYTTPQPGPDVRGLVEALERISDMDERSVVGDIPPLRQTRAIAMSALAAHRRAQQGGSHDT